MSNKKVIMCSRCFLTSEKPSRVQVCWPAMARTYLVFGDIEGKRFVRDPTHETVRTAAEPRTSRAQIQSQLKKPPHRAINSLGARTGSTGSSLARRAQGGRPRRRIAPLIFELYNL